VDTSLRIPSSYANFLLAKVATINRAKSLFEQKTFENNLPSSQEQLSEDLILVDYIDILLVLLSLPFYREFPFLNQQAFINMIKKGRILGIPELSLLAFLNGSKAILAQRWLLSDYFAMRPFKFPIDPDNPPGDLQVYISR
jgi:hypothetical protein